MTATLHLGDCLEVLPTIPDASVDCVISDPPYPMIKRDYGMMTEAAWMEMMQEVVRQTRRILNPTGSAVFILQPNSEKVGRMRLWLWKFMVWAGEEWGIVQDFWNWNTTAVPNKHANRSIGLARPSVKACIWLGDANCYRNQSAVLWTESDGNKSARSVDRAFRYTPRGGIMRDARCGNVAAERGGSTPFNLIPTATESHNSAGAYGHGAGTPLKLADWWTRYICPPGGVVADWFTGSGTMGLAALQNGCSFLGIEKMPKYYEIAQKRLAAEVTV